MLLRLDDSLNLFSKTHIDDTLQREMGVEAPARAVQTPSSTIRRKDKATGRQTPGTVRRAVEADKENMDANQGTAQPGAQPSQSLSSEQVAELYKNCIKLASENKISQKNTWSLQLIDHMSDLVKPSAEDGRNTNFQRASCTLDAGIKIYSYRVDSVHQVAYKMLEGLSRSAAATTEEGDEGDDAEGGEGEGGSQGGNCRKRGSATDADPCSTLESSFEALNVKKFDLAFSVDPLFHKTSAQFDEGGARGLLLNNLGVYRGCEIVFDSLDVPEQALADADASTADAQVDLFSLRQHLQILQEPPADAISPALDAIAELLGQPPQSDAAAAAAELVANVAAGGCDPGATDLASHFAGLGVHSSSAAQQSSEVQQPADGPDDDSDDGYDGGDMGGGDSGSEAGSPAAAAADSGSWLDAAPASASAMASRRDTGSPATSGPSNGLGEEAVQWLMEAGSRSGPVTRGAGWAGASHWRYRAIPEPAAEDAKAKPAARRKRQAAVIDFENLPGLPPETFKLASRKDQICLKTLTPKDTLLPEDLHYEAKQLVQLFLKTGMTLRSHTARAHGATHRPNYAEQDVYGSDNAGGDFADYGGGSDDEADARDAWGSIPGEDDVDLINEPRKVAKTSIAYARAAKQVDVAALKRVLWSGLQAARQQSPEGAPLQFQHIIAHIEEDSGAGALADISVALCFICLLHLCNELGLRLADASDLTTLQIYLP